MGPAVESEAIRYNGDPLVDAGYFPLILIACGASVRGMLQRIKVECWGGEQA